MYPPVLVTPPSILPVTLAEAKAHCVISDDGSDLLVDGLVAAATSHLDGWNGYFGRCLCEQTWRQDFDTFARVLRLRLGPVIAIEAITWRNAAGQIATVGPGNYSLQQDAAGAYVRFKAGFAAPADLIEVRAVSVVYRAGFEDVAGPFNDPVSTVPPAIRQAILLLVGHWYENREATAEGARLVSIPFGFDELVREHRAYTFGLSDDE